MIMNVKFDNEEIMNLLQQAKEQIDALRTTTMRLNAVLGIAVEKSRWMGPAAANDLFCNCGKGF